MRAVGPLADCETIARAGRVTRWMADGGALFRQFVEVLVEDNGLMTDGWAIDGRRVALDALTTPVALVFGSDDSSVPREANLPFLDAVASDDTRVFEMPTGHVGTFVPPTAYDTYWPCICEWLADRT